MFNNIILNLRPNKYNVKLLKTIMTFWSVLNSLYYIDINYEVNTDQKTLMVSNVLKRIESDYDNLLCVSDDRYIINK